MPNPEALISRPGAYTRRKLFWQSSTLALVGALPALGDKPKSTVSVAQHTGSIYREIGVRPLINARGTFTIITGSQTLPQVKEAMDEASRSYVQMD